VKETPRVEIGDLVVSVAESHGADFVARHDDFVIKGDNGSEAEKSGKLELLAQDLKTVLFTLTLGGLGIFKLEREERRVGTGRAEVAGVDLLRGAHFKAA
jgi:hypothetical protein